ncbi:MAG: multiheme c-type cytochrome [Planctomycetota bacterium]
MNTNCLPKLLVILGGMSCVAGATERITLPGTQPRASGLRIEPISTCATCHAHTTSGQHDAHASWQTGMMSYAAKDPLFRAAMAIAEQDIPGVGGFCLRCHTPGGFLAGRVSGGDVSKLTSEDLHGVSCSICHRMLDPRLPEASWHVNPVPPGIGNGMMVINPENAMTGPYPNDPKIRMRPHGVRDARFLASGHLCGTCHNVSNPLQASDVNKQSPRSYGHIERTYSEWLLSDYAEQGSDGACQSCHYPKVPGGGYPTNIRGNPKRQHYVTHGPVGGSTWIQDAIWHIWSDQGVDREALERGKQKAREFLRTAATLELSFPEAGHARLRITNHTGHKLPTGYPEGRRMWVNARYLDAQSNLLHEIGRYDDKEETVLGQPAKLPTLLDPESTRVYESLPALSPAQASKYNKEPGPSFFFALNDTIAKDNRIPPKGYQQARFAEHHCQPVGVEYADGQHWDEMDLELPPNTARVEVRLMYQSASAEYIKFLADTDQTSPWGRRVYETWQKTGQCPPEVIAEIAKPVGASTNQ